MATPACLLLTLILTGVQSHYEYPTLLDDKRLEHLLLAGKQILYKSHQESDVRQALGFSSKVWAGLTAVFKAAVPVLEGKSFARSQRDDATNGGDVENGEPLSNSSSDLIASNYLSLVKDIERLNDLCTIARNLLATTKRAQNLAAEEGFDQQVLALINVCVKVTARGFDGEGGNVRSEERWGKVVNLYKRLLITCLQFLHNFIMHNEQRKLVLWLDLFGVAAKNKIAEAEAARARLPTTEAANAQANGDAAATQQPQANTLEIEVTVEGGENVGEDEDVRDRVSVAMERLQQMANSNLLPSDMAAGLGYSMDDVHALFDMMSTEDGATATAQNNARLLMNKIKHDMERLSELPGPPDSSSDPSLKVSEAVRAQVPNKELPPSVEQAIRNAAMNIQRGQKMWDGAFDASSVGMAPVKNDEILEQDLQMPRSAQSAAETLQEAKDELMARLQDPPSALDDEEDLYDDDATASGIVENGHESGEEISDPEEDELDDEDEDDASDTSYRPSNDQERGLLTDVPLVLGPTEIEALPMIIQAGIVDNFGTNTKNSTPQHTAQERQNIRNMQSVRCHILLAQEAGRNVLRELLIFIAAWDLPDDEFYFKMMVQIMEAILKNGLMSHAYADFGQAKDIISPAQAVVVKILTHIYRSKYSPASAQAERNRGNMRPGADANDLQAQFKGLKAPAALTRVDVLTVRYIFTVFRGNIVPETCALIYLQGQIRQGLALAEDFPLNLWDMERVYEGVYQFLEFFAVLTENNDWNRLLVDWEIVYDLVTLIKELEGAVAKVNPLTVAAKAKSGENEMPPPALPAEPEPASTVPVAVERPYSLSPSPSPPPPLPTHATTNGTMQQPNNNHNISPPPLAAPPPPQPPLPEDPSTFPWRNLKKLIILVLSSLVWKSRHVQDQIRETGGVDVILNCTVHDANNPYIREHAVMCLKFLLEGNEVNQALVRELEKEGGVNGHAGWDKDQEGWVGGYNKAAEDVVRRGGVRGRAVSEGAMPAGGVPGRVAGNGGQVGSVLEEVD
ncbi:Copper transport protein 86 [Cyphellophora attinorum]|uniref:Ataxin-10 homolog n=1 Tax=Cyphellophora attinorum TaxID=1664694 RepID=A0A0N1H8C2_9EURO|nr:Copper transport protein 86 [Phialophora attinorum]KPI39305.1 Copper transport protein 86 [Phialophora attinorum]